MKYKVRNMYVFHASRKRVLPEGTIFDSDDEDIKGQEHKIDPVIEKPKTTDPKKNDQGPPVEGANAEGPGTDGVGADTENKKEDTADGESKPAQPGESSQSSGTEQSSEEAKPEST